MHLDVFGAASICRIAVALEGKAKPLSCVKDEKKIHVGQDGDMLTWYAVSGTMKVKIKGKRRSKNSPLAEDAETSSDSGSGSGSGAHRVSELSKVTLVVDLL